MTVPRITTTPTFGGSCTTVRAAWGTASVDAAPGHVVVAWKMNARAAAKWAKAWREGLVNFPSSVDVFVPGLVLLDVTPFLRGRGTELGAVKLN